MSELVNHAMEGIGQSSIQSISRTIDQSVSPSIIQLLYEATKIRTKGTVQDRMKAGRKERRASRENKE